MLLASAELLDKSLAPTSISGLEGSKPKLQGSVEFLDKVLPTLILGGEGFEPKLQGSLEHVNEVPTTSSIRGGEEFDSKLLGYIESIHKALDPPQIIFSKEKSPLDIDPESGQPSNAKEEVKEKRKRKKKQSSNADSDSWLPAGWEKIVKYRKMGKLAGYSYKLVNLKIGIPWDMMQVLPINQKINIAGIYVTCFDANHCPGSLIILFEPPNGQAALHTGDFRFCEEMTRNAVLQTCGVHSLILDTTYCDPQVEITRKHCWDALLSYAWLPSSKGMITSIMKYGLANYYPSRTNSSYDIGVHLFPANCNYFICPVSERKKVCATDRAQTEVERTCSSASRKRIQKKTPAKSAKSKDIPV
ncbi:hypothetical protein KY285_023885 [Solanum tuberosum]|nr:hypothetical protein KY289_024218 [Solanum tuberosum]KAH0676084.1 hypothetical protein KY285_023885 [Solanum tuberosum]